MDRYSQQGPRGGSGNFRRTDDRDRDPTRRPSQPYRTDRAPSDSGRAPYLRDDRTRGDNFERGPPRGDRYDRGGAPRGDRSDRGVAPRPERNERGEPPRGPQRRDRNDGGYPPGGREDRGPPSTGGREDRGLPSRGGRDSRSGPSSGHDRNEYSRVLRDDRGPPRGGNSERGQPNRGQPRERDTRAPPREEDLSNIVSLDKLKVPSSKWDVTANGFEKIPAERAKLIGLFQKPGTRKLHVDYNKLLSLLHGNVDLYSSGSSDITRMLIESSRINLTDARKSKTILVSNVDFEETAPEDVTQYINNFIITLDIDDHQGKDNVITNYKIQNKTLIVELLNAAVTTIAVALNGQLLPNSGAKLKITRPGGYISQAPTNNTQEGTESTEISDTVEENSEKIALTNIPKLKSKDEVIEMIELTSASKLKSFKLLKNQLTQESSGIAFLSFADATLGSVAIRKLHGHKFESNRLNCFKASDSILKQGTILNYFNLPEAVIAKTTPLNPPSKVVEFLNCIDFKDFSSEKVYEGIKKDFHDQCSICGDVLEVTIPKPVDIYKAAILHSEPGVGKVYVKFASVDGSKQAMEKLGGYKFGERTVLATFFNEQDYNLQLW